MRGRLCIDRFEAQLIDKRNGAVLSPDYPRAPKLLDSIFKVYAAGRWTMGDLRAQAMPLPPLLRPRDDLPPVIAASRADVRPTGYLSWFDAKAACEGAGKRLCKHAEWMTACRGAADRKFPYGEDYAHHKCNIWRYAHPAAALHGNAAIGHLDPRLHRVREGDRPLLHRTGANPACASRWKNDAAFDMVGNLDEWFDRQERVPSPAASTHAPPKKGCEAARSAGTPSATSTTRWARAAA